MTQLEITQHGWQQRRDDRRKAAQAKAPVTQAVAVIDQRADRVQMGQHGAGMLQYRFAQGGNPYLLPGASEKRQTERRFQPGDGLAGGGLGHARLFGGAGDVAAVGDRHHQAPMAEVHHCQ
ncbi:hypothetical protein A3Q32_12990 [Alcanivorax sp. KX64203]|nr:hypothetical protein A3Q32_12990 [Alcanivorax sp. KX64203]